MEASPTVPGPHQAAVDPAKAQDAPALEGSIAQASDLAPDSGQPIASVEQAAPLAQRIPPPAEAESPTTIERYEAEEARLVSQLEGVVTGRWAAVSGGLGGHEDSAPHEERLRSAAHLLALAFLTDAHRLDREALQSAVSLAADPSSPKAYRLLAAACLERSGMPEDAGRVVGEICTPFRGGAVAEEEREGPSGEFYLDRVTFASRIEGPGQFTEAAEEELLPGRTVFVYGEFCNAAAIPVDAGEEEGQEGASYRRVFSAYLTLLDAEGQALDRVDFLPRERGSHLSGRPDDLVNFWARYRVPPDLSPGSYRVVVTATDVLAGRSASQEIQFSCVQRGSH